LDETMVVNGLRGFETVANRLGDQRLDGCCRYAERQLVSALDVILGSGSAVAAVIEEAADQ